MAQTDVSKNPDPPGSVATAPAVGLSPTQRSVSARDHVCFECLRFLPSSPSDRCPGEASGRQSLRIPDTAGRLLRSPSSYLTYSSEELFEGDIYFPYGFHSMMKQCLNSAPGLTAKRVSGFEPGSSWPRLLSINPLRPQSPLPSPLIAARSALALRSGTWFM